MVSIRFSGTEIFGILGILVMVLLGIVVLINSTGMIQQNASETGYQATTMPESSGHNSYGAQMPSYWYYNPTTDKTNTLVSVVFAIIIPIITIVELHKGNKWITLGLAGVAAFFLSYAVVFALGAFGNLLSYKPNSETLDKYDAKVQTQIYGWGFLSLSMAAIAAAMLYFAEQQRKQNGANRSVYSVVAHAFGLMLSVYAATYFVIMSLSFENMMKDKYVMLSPLKLFGWALFSFAVGIVSWFLLDFSKKSNPECRITERAFVSPGFFVSGVLLAGGILHTLILVFALFPQYEYNERHNPAPNFVILMIFAAIFNFLSLFLINATVMQQEKLGMKRNCHYWLLFFGSMIIFFSLILLVFSAYASLYTGKLNNTAKAVLLTLAYGICLVYVSSRTMRRSYTQSPEYKYKSSLDELLESIGNREVVSHRSEIASMRKHMEEMDKRIRTLEQKLKKLEKA